MLEYILGLDSNLVILYFQIGKDNLLPFIITLNQ